MKSRIVHIESQRREKGILKIDRGENGNLKLEDRPKRRSSGLYWIFTSYTIEDLCKSKKSPQVGAVNIPQLSNDRRDLRNVIKPNTDNDFWIVYNGIGGCPKGSTGTYDLGSRIFQEFSDHQKTGSLKILGTTLNHHSE